ncbi:MAG: protoheme IX farnesyltransferase [Rhodospirillaceae bacterium]|nr:protoheme IX farnesyltransferase [Rhodospirillaceae bacterium]
MRNAAAVLYNVFKIRIGLAISITAVAGLAVTQGRVISAAEGFYLALAVLGASAAAGAFNHLVERDLDARMKRTRTRPFVTGAFRAGWPWVLGIFTLLAVSVGLAWWTINPVAALYVYLGAVVYGYVYTVLLKRRTVWNIVIGGLAGSFAVLAGAAAVDPTPGPLPLALAAILFLWTPPHFWSLAMALRDDYARAGVPMLPVVLGNDRAARVILAHTVMLVAVSMTPLALGLGWLYGVCAVVGGGWFIVTSWKLTQRPDRDTAMRNFFASLVQLVLVLAGCIIEGFGLV